MPDEHNESPQNARSLQSLQAAAGGSIRESAPASMPGHASPRDLPSILKQAERLLSDGNAGAALRLLAPVEKKIARDPRALFLFARALGANNRHDHAIRCAERSHRAVPDPRKLIFVANTARLNGDTNKAVKICEMLRQAHPEHATRASILAAVALEERGQFVEATAMVDSIEDSPTVPADLQQQLAMTQAKLLVHTRRYDEAIGLLDELIEEGVTQGPQLTAFHFLKAKAHDRAGRFDEAFRAADVGNQIDQIGYDPKLYDDQVSELIEVWNADAIGAFPRSSNTSEIPVFIAGMPRSGTSLIDQMIDAHPQASGVGELDMIESFARHLETQFDGSLPPEESFGSVDSAAFDLAAWEYIKQCTSLSPRSTLRVVNKALGNNKLVGLLANLFPRTRVIHAIRDPRDVAISCFMGGFNNRLHAWTTRIDWTASAWSQSLRMMDHWKQTLDVPILDVHYELLVADPESQFKRIIEFLGLQWHDACLDFHKTPRTVRTLSYDQVNRPIYTSSSGRYKNYAAHIANVEFPAYRPPAAGRGSNAAG